MPIACSLHDELEALATRGRECRIRFRDAEGAGSEVHARIVDIFARAGEEFVRLDSGLEIRLDRLEEVEGIRLGGAC